MTGCHGAADIKNMDLTNRNDIRALMTFYGVAPRKKYGQNFLTDTSVLDGIVDSAGLTGEDTVLEIGPGLGALTRRLAAAAGRVLAVEIDEGLIPLLKGTLSDHDNVTLINGDILKLDIEDLCREYAPGGRLHVVANLPYYITTPIVLRLLEHRESISDITVMIQKEVAGRMQAVPGGKEYGALSLAVQYYSDPEIVMNVSPDCFFPAPEVDSVVIRLKSRETPGVIVRDEKLMFDLIRATFNMRRKTMPNALMSAGRGFTRDQIESALAQMGKTPTVRGETFTLEEFGELADILATVP